MTAIRISGWAAGVLVVATVSGCAATPEATPAPLVTDVRTVASFDFAAGEAPENLTVDADGSVTISMLGGVANRPPRLVQIDMTGRRETIVTGAQGETFTGVIRSAEGTILYNVASSDAARAGVWRKTSGADPERVAALPPDALPNGLALDANRNVLYVSDSRGGTVWTATAAGGPARIWLTDPALTPAPEATLGANGLRFHHDSVWVANLSRGTLMRIPVLSAGTPGRVEVVSDTVAWIDDFSFLTDSSDVVIAALNHSDSVEVIYPQGSRRTLLTSTDGLASPTSTAVQGTDLYVTNGGLRARRDAKLLAATLDVNALLRDQP